jgi:hypothetical protein
MSKYFLTLSTGIFLGIFIDQNYDIINVKTGLDMVCTILKEIEKKYKK